jgi:hypothetical protein
LIGDSITAALYNTLLVSIVNEPFERRQEQRSVHMAAAWQRESLDLQPRLRECGIQVDDRGIPITISTELAVSRNTADVKVFLIRTGAKSTISR